MSDFINCEWCGKYFNQYKGIEKRFCGLKCYNEYKEQLQYEKDEEKRKSKEIFNNRKEEALENIQKYCVTFDGGEIADELKGKTVIGNNGKWNHLKLSHYDYNGEKCPNLTIQKNKVKLYFEINTLDHFSNSKYADCLETSGQLMLCLEYITGDKTETAATVYCNPIGNIQIEGIETDKFNGGGEVTTDYKAPEVFNDDTITRFSLYELNGEKKWLRLDKVDLPSINQKKEEERRKIAQAEIRAENAKKEKIRKAEEAARERKRAFDKKVHFLPFTIMCSVPLWYGLFGGYSIPLLIDILWCGFCIINMHVGRPKIFKFISNDEIGILADALIPFIALLAIGRGFVLILIYVIIIAVMVMIAFLLKFLLKIRTKIIMILGYALCAAAFIVPLVLSFVS